MKPIFFFYLVLLLFKQEAFGQGAKPDKFYVFVGEKIEVKEFQVEAKPGTIIMNQGFKAKYKVLKNLYGNFSKDTIEFDAYDHYGFPGFANYSHVLLYVSEYNGRLYHEKYQFSPVYKTGNNRWAGPYAKIDYEHPYAKSTTLKPEKISFPAEAAVDISKYSPERIPELFPQPYYTVGNGRAMPLMGNYIEEMFQLKKEGILKARGIF
ncbi:hypothetical protein ACFST9_02875 [Hymenobacter monticola]|uniref:DUF4468 domain-containing protein n=1 Tax=Hymenobacter monticola TaxID=1705399 RepID=A0ABY4B1R5_9BACT|nr:hypothetical protein [Hymenobacter monticola]UOE33096.1 hypothetical protein MTP16_18455 [Hymenobacter monticola]